MFAVSWKCDWCGYPLEVVNKRIMCMNCRQYKGKDGKEHEMVLSKEEQDLLLKIRHEGSKKMWWNEQRAKGY